MKMMKIDVFLAVLLGTILTSFQNVYAQLPATGQGEKIVLTNLDNFESAGEWEGKMPREDGIIRVMRREGIPQELAGSDPGARYVLGAKISFFRRAAILFAVAPPTPRRIIGEVKSLKVWVIGRGFRHQLKAALRDLRGRAHLIRFNEFLDFNGWRQLEAPIPKNQNIVQEDYRYGTGELPLGLYFESLMVDCNLVETFGRYYLYLDNLEAEVNIFPIEELKAAGNNMSDDW